MVSGMYRGLNVVQIVILLKIQIQSRFIISNCRLPYAVDLMDKQVICPQDGQLVRDDLRKLSLRHWANSIRYWTDQHSFIKKLCHFD